MSDGKGPWCSHGNEGHCSQCDYERDASDRHDELRVHVSSRLLAAYVSKVGLISGGGSEGERLWCKHALKLADTLIEEATK